MSWKREEIPDHKFDYIDENDFIDHSCARQLQYTTVFIYTLKDILVYMADLGSIVILVASNKEQLSNLGTKSNNASFVLFNPELLTGTNAQVEQNQIIETLTIPILFLLIMTSLIVSFILLAFEWYKAQKIIRSRDISYAFTSLIAYRYYAIRSYAHYCLFSQIQSSRKTLDVLAFWVFFKFKGVLNSHLGWKRLLLAEFPRQFLNMVIIFSIFKAVYNTKLTPENARVAGNFRPYETIVIILTEFPTTARIFLGLQAITVSIWLVAAIQLLAAFILYVPLLFQIRGNLKEYCVHKIDKRYLFYNTRIAEILKRKSRKRIQEARRQERERIEDSQSEASYQPTLPKINIDLNHQYQYQPTQFAIYPKAGSVDHYSEQSSEHGGERYQRKYYQPYAGYTEPFQRNPSRQQQYQYQEQHHYQDPEQYQDQYQPQAYQPGYYYEDGNSSSEITFIADKTGS